MVMKLLRTRKYTSEVRNNRNNRNKLFLVNKNADLIILHLVFYDLQPDQIMKLYFLVALLPRYLYSYRPAYIIDTYGGQYKPTTCRECPSVEHYCRPRASSANDCQLLCVHAEECRFWTWGRTSLA